MTIRNATPYNLQEGNYTLYRLWSGDMLLLYVGLTLNPGNRFGQYNRMMSWWPQVTYISIEHLESVSRIAAHAAEAAAIQAEQPRYNRQHITRRAGRPRMSSEP